ncbi:TspO/MBR family protein [Oleiagrimonas sp.]|jgi:benzodiazapine receptor|uniref:TspO/MBR family protein n=1 Tax=Oleiagrimonas sp. TaxID=2010330 RepID=UPI002605E488|nr:TspO/MBR family protein [Oleiagrimonas sp.]MDA3913889.1 tryptophan-rich sensory protein [Oleiagrimonas sp.]
MRNAIALFVFLLLVAIVATLGSLFPPGDWYAALQQPFFTPPNLVFPIAWTLLYLTMAFAAWRVWLRVGLDVAMGLWGAQLVANAAWSWIVFGRHALGWGLIDIVLLLVLIVVTMVAFFRRDRGAGWLMLPYLAWVGFATVLNAALWHLNPAG